MHKSRLVAACMALSAAVVCWADAPALSLTLATENNEPYEWSPIGTPVGENVYSYAGSGSEAGWVLAWTILGDPDPYVNAVLGVTNTDVTTQTFTLEVILPIDPPLASDTLMGASFGGALTDSNFDGSATLGTDTDTPLFQALIDGADVLSLYPDPFSLSTTFAGETINLPAVNYGLPGPTLPGPQALTSIGIRHVFTLTPGDSVAFSSFFVVIPEPATALLLGLLSLVRRR